VNWLAGIWLDWKWNIKRGFGLRPFSFLEMTILRQSLTKSLGCCGQALRPISTTAAQDGFFKKVFKIWVRGWIFWESSDWSNRMKIRLWVSPHCCQTTRRFMSSKWKTSGPVTGTNTLNTKVRIKLTCLLRCRKWVIFRDVSWHDENTSRDQAGAHRQLEIYLRRI